MTMDRFGQPPSADEPMPTEAGSSCHVLQVGFGSEGDRWNATASSLPARAVEALRDASRPEGNELAMGRRVRAVAARYGLPGIILIWNGTPFPPDPGALPHDPSAYLAVPAPWPFPLEPHELSSNDPTIATIAGSAESSSQSGRPAADGATFLGRLSYWRIGQGGVFGLAAGVIVGMGLFWLGLSRVTVYGPSADACCCVPCIASLICGLGWAYVGASGIGGQWFLVPGGLVVRRRRFGSHSPQLTCYSRCDSVLLVHPSPSGWRAVVLRDDERAVRILTRAEVIALLRVWQSPCLPPDPAQLDDLS